MTVLSECFFCTSQAAGEVWSGVLNGTLRVAVKKMFNSTELDTSEDSEISFLQRARHPKLVMFIGCGRMDDGNIFLVLEFMNSGDLQGLLWGNDGSLLWTTRLSLLKDVAEGMSYLHETHHSIHRDLKSPNILLAKVPNSSLPFVAKVADFGLSKILSTIAKNEKEETRAVSTKVTVTSPHTPTELTCGKG